MPKEYLTFISDAGILPEGAEIKLALRDLTPGKRKYDCRIVKAIVSKTPEALPMSDFLWLRSLAGTMLFSKPWAIKITEELGDRIPSPPFQGGTEVTKILNADRQGETIIQCTEEVE
jgi:hypothetical protein